MPMTDDVAADFRQTLQEIKNAGTYNEERVITSQQDADIEVEGGQHVINFCANNYLGLANHPEIMDAAKRGVDRYGFGVASVRFICGTQSVHKDLEHALSDFHETGDTILYNSCFDANTGLFETILGEDDAIISDALNHASIIDGIRLCKADLHVFDHSDMADLEAKLQAAQDAETRMIATDGVFSMDGDVAKLDEMCRLADAYDALVMVDECHATGFMGEGGRGASEAKGVLDEVDIITSTLGKALGGATGGFTTGRKEIIDLLRQESRPYLFSNAIAPMIANASLKVLEMLQTSGERREQIWENARYFRSEMEARGFEIKPGEHPIVPIMFYDAKTSGAIADELLDRGIYVISFSYPVVPEGEARIRVQMSAAHSKEQLDRAIDAFTEVGRKHDVIE
ncbi:glycine C-acetyltransferase [Salinibacter ruber]|uniref:glycine C-acetyltransferase n=3 Tax=Salinibacter ruber TaxID=146919 RepID=UPI000E5973B8|nr:glycine C-acetyltransferase [Salinibacter ruber]MCS3650329.1 glycine C-acetyltransferase [Salinibacter ruber]MCS3653582.1 glycine C-acetyltransferase [Salinibacter ruber]MCS3755891.1 glycine C-acetyltransferase [Salinibacter ruber]MCS4085881.1 glycine C-acetyltransferase [Salinibacter ruber]